MTRNGFSELIHFIHPLTSSVSTSNFGGVIMLLKKKSYSNEDMQAPFNFGPVMNSWTSGVASLSRGPVSKFVGDPILENKQKLL